MRESKKSRTLGVRLFGLAAAGAAAAVSPLRRIEIRIDAEPELIAVDLNGSGGLVQALFHQKGVSVNLKNFVGVSLLIQSKPQLGTASTGGHIHPNRRYLCLVLEVLVQQGLGTLGDFYHAYPPLEVIQGINKFSFGVCQIRRARAR
jgi:hypothetical protein